MAERERAAACLHRESTGVPSERPSARRARGAASSELRSGWEDANVERGRSTFGRPSSERRTGAFYARAPRSERRTGAFYFRAGSPERRTGAFYVRAVDVRRSCGQQGV